VLSRTCIGLRLRPAVTKFEDCGCGCDHMKSEKIAQDVGGREPGRPKHGKR
jgi:hypothetical protein